MKTSPGIWTFGNNSESSSFSVIGLLLGTVLYLGLFELLFVLQGYFLSCWGRYLLRE